jgi:XRE family transcriptional regulator, regulator of sulfur utilization
MRLKRVREAKGLSQTALAKRSKLSREHIVRLEGGRYDPTVTTLTKLAKALGVPVTALLE